MKQAIPDAVLAQHLAIIGKTGAGKTITEKLCVEQVVSHGARVCVLDTVKSDWWGVTSSADGKKPGLPFKVLGGPHGHVPIHSSAGKAIGQLVGSGKLPLSIIDMAEFEPGGVQKFFVDFAPALMKAMRGVVYLVIEEAHEIAPKERAGFNAENMSIHFAKKLATAGRSRGIRLIVATQSVQQLHNRVLGSCDTLIAMRLTAPADQEPIKKWLKGNVKEKQLVEEIEGSLSSLKTGTGWVCSGEAQIFERVTFPMIKTYDNTSTPTGDGKGHEITTAPVDQDELRSIIGDAVAEAEADDPKKLRAEVVRLQGELASRPTEVQVCERVVIESDPEEIKKAHRAGFDSGYDRGAVNAFQVGVENLMQIARDVTDVAAKLERFRDGPKRHDGYPEYDFKPSGPAGGSTTPAAPRLAATIPSVQRATSSPAPGGDDTLAGPVRRILDSLEFWIAVGDAEPSRAQVAFVAGYSPKSSGFEKALSTAKTAGFVTYPNGGQVHLTETGRARAGRMSADEARRAIASVLSNPQRIVTDALISVGKPISRERLAAETNYSDKSSGYEKVLSQLNTLGIAFYPSAGHVQITDWAMRLLS